MIRQHPSPLVRRVNTILLAVYPLAFALCTHFINASVDPGIFGSLFFIPLVFAAWNWGLKKAMILAGYGAVLNFVIISIDLAFLKHIPFTAFEAFLGFMLGFVLYLVVGFIVGKLSDANRALNKALNEVKVLKGFIPICAKCKQIRDDQGYWRHIEEYIRERSEAVFSHDLCPKCAHELYGDPLVPPEKAGEAVRENGSPQRARVMEYGKGHQSRNIRRLNIAMLALYPVAYALSSHFVNDSGIFGSLFFIPLVVSGWTWGFKKAPIIAAYGVITNNVMLTLEYVLIQRRPFVFFDMAIGSVLGFAVYAIVGLVAGRMGDTNRALNKALNEVKVLRGLIPICANCKQIRDDQGYWRQIEEYIRENSEAVFSHGLCPNCAREIYGDAAIAPEKADEAAR